MITTFTLLYILLEILYRFWHLKLRYFLHFDGNTVKIPVLAAKNQDWRRRIYFYIYFINTFTLMATRANKLNRRTWRWVVHSKWKSTENKVFLISKYLHLLFSTSDLHHTAFSESENYINLIDLLFQRGKTRWISWILFLIH